MNYGKKKYDNEFKTMIVELLNSEIKMSQLSNNYGLNASMISRWNQECKLKSGDFSKNK